MAESVSFKVYLKEELGREDQAEIRRFPVSPLSRKIRRFSFTNLQEKLAAVFPRLQNAIFTVNWIDEDGDSVTIASDEDLIIALTDMKGPLFKFHVHVKEEKKNVEDKKCNKMRGKVHPNITCDSCESKVVGFRYKCIVCEDYDLCGQCDAAGIHPDHNMIRIASPGNNMMRRTNMMETNMMRIIQTTT